MTPSDGILLIGHGTRDPAGVAEFLRVVEWTAERAGCPVEGAFLELVEPNIEQGLARLAARGARRITAVPMLLFSAGHAQRDVPQALAEGVERLGLAGVEIRETAPFDCHPAIVRLSAERYAQALAGRPPIPAEETCLVLAARGSRDPQALANLARFAAARRKLTPCGHVELGFVAVAVPSLERALEDASLRPVKQIVVQPHLLFSGQVLDELRAAVDVARARHADREWLTADALGADPALVDVVLSLAQ